MMERDEAIQLLRGGPEGVAEWNRQRVAAKRIVSLKNAFLLHADLSRANLRGADLRGANLVGACLVSADLRRAKLKKAKLSEAKLQKADLREADVSDVEGFDADLRHAQLSNADLSWAWFRGALFNDAILNEATMIRAILSETDFRGAEMRNAKLIGTDLRGASLSECCLIGADLSEARLQHTDLRRTNLRDANLSNANVGDSRLGGSDCAGADLRLARFVGADLEGTNLSEAKLFGADFSESILTGADFTRASLFNTRFANVDLSGVQALESAVYAGPSTIGTDTLRQSKGKIPGSFLLGCGLAPWEVLLNELYDLELTAPGLFDLQGRIFDAWTKGRSSISGCFISHSWKDVEFVDQLRDRLMSEGISVWLDRHDMVAGTIQHQVWRAIQGNRVVLIVLSKHSVESDWVESELEMARNKEKDQRRDVLCPIALDETWKKKVDAEAGPGDPSRHLWRTLQQKFIVDFSGWETGRFEESLKKLVRGLKTNYGSK